MLEASIPGKPRIVIAVVSDLHAYDTIASGPKRPSHLKVGSTETQSENHPISGLKQLIASEKLTADALLCPGDIGHQACPVSIEFGWTALKEIRTALNSPTLIATAGNHDVDSHHLVPGNPDPQQTLKNLSEFPCVDEATANLYWAREYAVLKMPPVGVLNFNSSAHHGNEENEKNHGRITKEALSFIRSRLADFRDLPIKILLCHHHPHQHSELNLGAADVMEKGQQLLDVLALDADGTWVVVHGHKHHPKITYAAGGSNSPVVFAAGSLCSELFLELQTAARNQFHLITFDLNDIKELGLVGRVKSWYWLYGTGWAPAKPATGLPYECGFGCRGQIRTLADRIASLTGGKLTRWTDLTTPMRELHYLIPQDADLLRRELLRRHRIKLVDDENGQPVEVGGIVDEA
jgi:predicted phosphodiesterase